MTEKFEYDFDWNYNSNEQKRERLFPLFKTVFDMSESDLRELYASGFANPTYTPFTYFHDGNAVANVSMFDLPMMIDGRKVNAAGIQSVMTDPGHRRKGLFRRLFEIMLTELDRKYDASFLFTSSPELYTPFGFREVDESYFISAYSHHQSGQGSQSLRRLDLSREEDIQVLKEQFKHHAPVSHVFAPLSYGSSFYLNMLDPQLQSNLHYSDKLNAMIVFEIEGETLKLYDIVGKEMPKLDEIAASIGAPIAQVELYFHPDLLHPEQWKPVPSSGHLMVRGDIELPNSFHFLKTGSF